MSVDKLQEKIRKLKNPTVIDFTLTSDQIPQFLLEQEENSVNAYGRFCCDLLNALKGIVPAVRFSYGFFSLLGPDGLTLLQKLLNIAKNHGFYIFLDVCEVAPHTVEFAAKKFCELPVDAFVSSQYTGEDAITPYVKACKAAGKSVFVNLRTPNKSAAQLQDLMTGSRLVHMAGADIVKRIGESYVGKSGYSSVAGVSAANAANSVRSLRGKYKNMFLMIDGYDYSNANAKNCSFAFDNLGHGAVVCAGSSVTCAWRDEDADSRNYTESAVRAAEKMRKNLTRYVTIL